MRALLIGIAIGIYLSSSFFGEKLLLATSAHAQAQAQPQGAKPAVTTPAALNDVQVVPLVENSQVPSVSSTLVTTSPLQYWA